MTNLSHKNDLINVYVEIIHNNKTYFEDLYFPCKNEITDKKEIKKNYTCSVTKAFVKCAKKIRDVNLPWGVMSGIRPAKVVRQLKEEGYNESEIEDILISLYDVSKEK